MKVNLELEEMTEEQREKAKICPACDPFEYMAQDVQKWKELMQDKYENPHKYLNNEESAGHRSVATNLIGNPMVEIWKIINQNIRIATSTGKPMQGR